MATPTAFANPASLSATLLQALQCPTPSTALTPDLLSTVPSSALYHLLPLLLPTLQTIGEQTTDRPAFITLLSALHSRLISHRPLKLRFLLHLKHPALAAYWRVELVPVDGNAYHTSPVSDQNDEGDCEEEKEEDNDCGSISRTVSRAISLSDDECETGDETGGQSVRQVRLRLRVDAVDRESVWLWSEGVHCGDVEEGRRYAAERVCNVFYETGGGECVGEGAEVRRVFSSIARPRLVGVCGGVDEGEGDWVGSGVLVKAGDNLVRDTGVMCVFQWLNWVWAGDDWLAELCEGRAPPVAGWYDVVATGVDRGVLRAVGGLQSLREFEWEAWVEEVEGDPGRVWETVRSAAGAYAGTYIVGGRDRHFDNIVMQDGTTLLHLDFTYILGEGPPLDSAAISLAHEMEDAFRTLGVWDSFITLCTSAYTVARRNAPALLRLLPRAFTGSGTDETTMLQFMSGKRSLNLEAGEEEASLVVERQVRMGGCNAQTWVKRVAHDVIDPAWYGLLRRGFPPAVAVMKWLDESENAEAVRLANELREKGERVREEDMVHIDE